MELRGQGDRRRRVAPLHRGRTRGQLWLPSGSPSRMDRDADTIDRQWVWAETRRSRREQGRELASLPPAMQQRSSPALCSSRRSACSCRHPVVRLLVAMLVRLPGTTPTQAFSSQTFHKCFAIVARQKPEKTSPTCYIYIESASHDAKR